MSALYDSLQRLADQVRKRLPHVRGEEATKQALILPFLSALGYDIYDPTEVRPEYVADFAKKRSGGPAEKVDYAIHLGGTPVILIEAKAADVDLVQHSGQLARYFNATPSCPVAVLGNGTRYLFFTDLEEKNILSEKPFFELDMLGFTESDAEILEGFTRDRFNPATVREQAEDIIYTSKISGYISNALRSPTEAFTRFVLSEVGVFAGKKVTAKVVEKFTPTIRRAIQAALLDMATRSIKEQSDVRPETTAAPPPRAAPPEDKPVEKAVDKASEKPAAKPADKPAAKSTEKPADKPVEAPAAKPADKPAEPPASNIVTTGEELEALDIISSICADSTLASIAPILHKDTASWFTISTISIRRWFVRLYFNQKRRSILTNVAPERTRILCPGFETDGSRVYLSAVKDLHRLRPLLLFAYEEALRQKEPAGSDDAG